MARTPPQVLQNAALKAAEELGLGTISFDTQANRDIVEIYVRLYSLTGGDRSIMAHWISTRNKHLPGVPTELMATSGGRNRILAYLGRISGH